MTTVQHITEQARELRLSSLVTDLPALLEQARREEPSYTEFAALLLDTESLPTDRKTIWNVALRPRSCRGA